MILEQEGEVLSVQSQMHVFDALIKTGLLVKQNTVQAHSC